MKESLVSIVIILFVILGAFGNACVNSKDYKPVEIIRDTVYIDVPVTDSSVIAQNDSLYLVIDSLEQLNNKYEEELNIALFKLERIKDYNRIAANGSNIKYLRGWINRVLNE